MPILIDAMFSGDGLILLVEVIHSLMDSSSPSAITSSVILTPEGLLDLPRLRYSR